jgi:hypothetical protein
VLGELKLLDVRSLWPNESSDFTPWLANAENISRLGAALGLELEVESTEVAVGPYAADILARDSGTGGYVVIENQLGKTDHDHLGKAITYAAVLAAGAIVWVAPEFTEEHRKAIDWLNDNSFDDVSFYGVRIELWQIDTSKPAVRFNVLSRPSEVARKAAVTKASAALSDAKKLQFQWWTEFRKALLEQKVVTSAQAAAPRYWHNVALGRTGFHLSNICDTYANRIGVRVYMRHKHGGDAALAQLLEQKQDIEAEIGQPLIWNANPEALDKTITLVREVDLNDRERWPEYLSWMVRMTEKFRTAFAPRVRKLSLVLENEAGEDPEE